MIEFHKFILEHLTNRQEAVKYLNAALESSLELDDESYKLFFDALRNVAEAQGGITALANKAGVGRESLYKTLSGKVNPKLKTVFKLCDAMGFKLEISLKG